MAKPEAEVTKVSIPAWMSGPLVSMSPRPLAMAPSKARPASSAINSPGIEIISQPMVPAKTAASRKKTPAATPAT